uniref:Vacuolar cation/proton exchanger n=1 Tax=Anthurium amnicola TaxID=1678845 RepID=A0A1D1ZL20_9ARAE
MSGAKEDLQVDVAHSHLEMSSLDTRLENDFEDVGQGIADGRAGTPGVTQHVPLPVARRRCGINCLGSTLFCSLRTVIFTPKLNVLLPCGPGAILVHTVWRNQGLVFILSLLGIIPLAERIGYVTEQLAFFTGATVGGLLNCTFGNATEVVISIFALKNGMMRIVQQSLLGSILSNMLLVLGFSFFGGGIVSKKAQVFDKASAVMNSGMLLMAVMGLLFPAVLHYTHTEAHFGKSELALSRFSSCVMMAAYAGHLFHELKSKKSHNDQVNEEAIESEVHSVGEEVAEISKWEAIIWLVIFTAWISVISEFLVDTIEGAAEEWNIPITFISVVMLPVIGNASEHASAIMFAMKDKLDLTLGIAIGSSTQISMFGIPFAVVVGWIMGHPMDLNFHLFETAALFITVLVVAILLQEGTSNYSKGMLLVLCYTIVAASFFLHTDATSTNEKFF